MKREDREQKIEQAWGKLYKQLEQDGLLPDENRKIKKVSRILLLKRVASIAALTIGVVFLFFWLRPHSSVDADRLVLHNPEGEPTLVTTFEDGSIIYLSEQASVEYPEYFAQDKREVTLQGDAFFEVSANNERPFVVHTRMATIEVLGTSFSVKSRDKDPFSLSVRTGRVKITSKKNHKSVYVNAGETALLEGAQWQTSLTGEVLLNDYLRYIHFKDQTLADIIRFINQSTDSIQIKTAPELDNRRITVTFLNATPETVAQILCPVLDSEFYKQENVIYITPK